MILEIGVLLLLVSLVLAPPTDGQTRTLFEIFNSASLNTTLWNYGYPWGAYDNHRANTLPRQVKVTPEGLLNLIASRERSTGITIWTEFGQTELEFTSGAINTNGRFCIKNGYVEVSLRAADTTSTWPNVFLVPEDQGRVPMITIMEVFDDRSRYSYGFKYTNEQGTIEAVTKVAANRSTSDDFHRFGVDWGYDQITWYYDDQWVDTITKSKELKQVDRMCLVIGLGVGGKSKDSPIDPRGYPSTMSADVVDIWQPNYDGFYKFQNVQTGFLMEIEAASYTSGASVVQWPDNDGDWQVRCQTTSRALTKESCSRVVGSPSVCMTNAFSVNRLGSTRRLYAVTFLHRNGTCSMQVMASTVSSSLAAVCHSILPIPIHKMAQS